MEADGLEKVRIEVRKRVTRERRIVATKRDGLLVDAHDVVAGGPKVPQTAFLAAVAQHPGLTALELAPHLGVKDRTVRRYAEAAGSAVRAVETALQGSAKRVQYFPIDADSADSGEHEHLSAPAEEDETNLVNEAERIFGDMLRPPAEPTDLSAMVTRRRADA